MDFVIENNGRVLPIEVKSGKDYKRHSALENILSDVNYGICEAIVFSNANVEVVGKRVYMPIYMIMFLKNEPLQDSVYKIDLTGI